MGDEYVYHNYASSNCCICMLCNLRYRERYQRKEQSISSLCIVRNSIFLINRWNYYTNWDWTEWFFDSVLAKENIDIGFIDWFFIGLPVSIAVARIMDNPHILLFPLRFEANELAKKPIHNMLKNLGPMSYEEKIVGIIFFLQPCAGYSGK